MLMVRANWNLPAIICTAFGLVILSTSFAAADLYANEPVVRTLRPTESSDSAPIAEWFDDLGNARLIGRDERFRLRNLLNSLGVPRVVVSTDQRIGDPLVGYKDPEFWLPAGLMVWQDNQEQIWLCRISRLTGEMTPRDGRGMWVGVGAPVLTPGQVSSTVINGPEFGLSRRGLGVYFCGAAENTQYPLVRVGFPDLGSERIGPETLTGFRGAMPSSGLGDSMCRVLYGRLIKLPNGSYQTTSEWIEEDDPETVRTYPRSTIGTSGTRWIPGERAISTFVSDPDGIVQIARYDVDSEELTFLTTGPEEKTDGFFFDSPEHADTGTFLCVVARSKVAFYREFGREWRQVQLITPPPSDVPNVTVKASSAEPFIYRNRSYVCYLAQYSNGVSRVCIASLDGSVNAVVSKAEGIFPLDPETVVYGDRLWVYYWTRPNASGVEELHRCRVQIFP